MPTRSSGDDDDEEEDLSSNKIVQFCKSLMSFSDTYDGDKFFTVKVRRRRGWPHRPRTGASSQGPLGCAATARRVCVNPASRRDVVPTFCNFGPPIMQLTASAPRASAFVWLHNLS